MSLARPPKDSAIKGKNASRAALSTGKRLHGYRKQQDGDVCVYTALYIHRASPYLHRRSQYGTNSKKTDFLLSIDPTRTSAVLQTSKCGAFTV